MTEAVGHLVRMPEARIAPWQRIDSKWFLIGIPVLLVAWLALVPLVFLLWQSFLTPQTATVPARYTLDNFRTAYFSTETLRLFLNSAEFAIGAAALSLCLGTALAWMNERTNTPFKKLFFGLSIIPLVIPSILFAVSWIMLASPKIGIINGVLQGLFSTDTVFVDIYTMTGMVWVDGLHYSPMAFLLMTAAFRAMDPALEESARVMGASKLRTTLTVTLPLVMPGVLGASLFVFAEMLGSFAAALVLGIPGRIYVITTAIWDSTLSYPPAYGRASAMGLALFVVMFGMLTFYRRVIARGSFATITGKAFRPRPMDMGRMVWVLFSVCLLYIMLAVVLPIAALVFTSLQRFATVILSQAEFTLANYQTALSLGPVRTAMGNSLMLGFGVASVGVLVMVILVWIIYRSQLVGRGAVEYLVMFPQAVPRLVFGLALLWAWLNIPIPIYGTLWLLALAYFTVMLPLGVRTLAGVVLQIDKSLEECARVCGAGWVYQMRTVTLPLLKPGMLAAWLLIFMACVRELGASVFLMGPNAKVIAPSIVAAFASSGTELTAAMALIQTFTVIVALAILFRLTRGVTKELS